MYHVANVGQRCFYDLTVLDRAAHDFDPLVCFQFSLVAQRPHYDCVKAWIG